MRISIDLDLCQGHGVCANEAPELFEIDADGRATLLLEDPLEELRSKAANALRYCPTGAISIAD